MRNILVIVLLSFIYMFYLNDANPNTHKSKQKGKKPVSSSLSTSFESSLSAAAGGKMKETGGKKIWKKIGSFLGDKKQKAIKESSSSSSSTSIEIEHIGLSNRQFGCQNSSQGCSTSRDPVRYQAETSWANKSADNRRRPTNQSDRRYKENPGKILTEKHRYSSRHTVGIRENKPLVIRSDSQDTVANRQGQETRQSSRRNNVRIRENERIPTRQGSDDTVANRTNAGHQSIQSINRHSVGNKGKQVHETRSGSSETVINPVNERAGTNSNRRDKILKQLNEEGFDSEHESRPTVGIRQNKKNATRRRNESTVAKRNNKCQDPRQPTSKHTAIKSVNKTYATRTDHRDTVDNRANFGERSQSYDNRHPVGNELHEQSEVLAEIQRLAIRSDNSDTVIKKTKTETRSGSNLSNDRDSEKSRAKIDQSVKKQKSKECCSICLSKIGSKAKQIKCQHIFHEQCIDRWLQQNTTCPICRQSLTDAIAEPSTDFEFDSFSFNLADPSSSLPEVGQAPDRTDDEGPYNAADFAIDVVATAGRGLFHALSFVGNTINAFITEENETQNNGTNGLIINEQLQMVYPGSIIDAIDTGGRRYSVQVVDVQLNMNPPYMTVVDRFNNTQETVYIERFGTDNNYITVRDNEGNLNTGRIVRVLQPNQNQYLQQ